MTLKKGDRLYGRYPFTKDLYEIIDDPVYDVVTGGIKISVTLRKIENE